MITPEAGGILGYPPAPWPMQCLNKDLEMKNRILFWLGKQMMCGVKEWGMEGEKGGGRTELGR